MLYPDISSTRSANLLVASNTTVLCALAAILLAFSGDERISIHVRKSYLLPYNIPLMMICHILEPNLV